MQGIQKCNNINHNHYGKSCRQAFLVRATSFGATLEKTQRNSTHKNVRNDTITGGSQFLEALATITKVVVKHLFQKQHIRLDPKCL